MYRENDNKTTLSDLSGKFKSDLHTHTIVSGHAYTTLLENINYCKKTGIKILGTSEHGPQMGGSPHLWYFNNMKVVPRIIKGVTILRGCEVNILNIDGDVDLELSNPKVPMDYAIASFHEPIFRASTLEVNTKAVINTMENNPVVVILGHMGNPSYPIDYEAVVKKAKELDVIMEINCSSIRANTARKGSEPNCKKIAELCKEYGTKVIINSDAHICYEIGKFEKGIELLDSIDFPEELLMNEPKKIVSYLQGRGKALDIDITKL